MIATSGPDFGAVRKALITPGMHALGFAVSSDNYSMRVGDAWLMVNIQKERRPGGLAMTDFTANLGVASRRLLQAEGRNPDRAPPRSAWHREDRIGGYLGNGSYRWWTIEDGPSADQTASVVADFLQSLAATALPNFARYTSDAFLRDDWLRELHWLTPPERDRLAVLIETIGPPVPEVVRGEEAETWRTFADEAADLAQRFDRFRKHLEASGYEVNIAADERR